MKKVTERGRAAGLWGLLEAGDIRRIWLVSRSGGIRIERPS